MVYAVCAYSRGPVFLSALKKGRNFLEGITGAFMNGKRVTVQWFFGGCDNRFPLILDQAHSRFMQVAVASQVASAYIFNNAIKWPRLTSFLTPLTAWNLPKKVSSSGAYPLLLKNSCMQVYLRRQRTTSMTMRDISPPQLTSLFTRGRRTTSQT